ncbi:hypothetical protein J7I93_00195 [Bacillus sp. ISL-47]|uniref:hypothetical protein n=1 Tax=Bacillus sp. ISL-47 TaxID=2819130 RepID=UPI001BE62866|nr:hypothetical protein [Bacillus sp. ISL-47]MBT2686595.1 hypothetical protein [Bacillus sp. ISL-47]MBT2706987.1 hypothetical protein [Pseudomonas sp. ISL-84]
MLSNFYGSDTNINQLVRKEVEEALKGLVINIDFKPQINVINDTQREVAIGEQGVGAGENTNIGIVGANGSSAAGENPEAASVGDDGTAQTT